MLRWTTILLSILGLCIGVWAVATADEKKPVLPLARPASVNPYGRGVAALGIVEPAGKNVSIFAPESGMVMEVFADVNDTVKAGTPLFRLDTRRVDADLIRAQAALAGGEAEVARWHALPRVEDVPPLEAAVAAAESLWKDREEQRRATSDAAKNGSSTDRDVSRATLLAEVARAELERAKADLAKMKAGGWKPDLAVAETSLARLRAEVQAQEILKDRLTVRAPGPGQVLRRQIEPGEFAGADPNRPAMIIGDLEHLNIRAQVDEEDISLVTTKAKAVGRTRGAVVEDIAVELLRIEPFARPKSDLNGANTERVDTRVIDVLFRVITPPKSRIYPGQAVDIFIDAAE